ncbi:hypothetical protein [Anaerosporobacter sp.]
MFVSNTKNVWNVVTQQQKKLVEQEKKEKPSFLLESLVDREDEQERVSARTKSIRNKLLLGKKLTASDLEYLRQHDSMLYLKAIKIEMSRKIMKQQIKNCKTKEEVQRVVSTHMSGIRGTKEDVQMEQAAIADESSKAMKEKRYKELPATEEKRKEEEENYSSTYTRKKKHQEEQKNGRRFNCDI